MPNALASARVNLYSEQKIAGRPSLRQLVALRLLGHRGPEPRTRRAASQLINLYLQRKGGRYG